MRASSAFWHCSIILISYFKASPRVPTFFRFQHFCPKSRDSTTCLGATFSCTPITTCVRIGKLLIPSQSVPFYDTESMDMPWQPPTSSLLKDLLQQDIYYVKVLSLSGESKRLYNLSIRRYMGSFVPDLVLLGSPREGKFAVLCYTIKMVIVSFTGEKVTSVSRVTCCDVSSLIWTQT